MPCRDYESDYPDPKDSYDYRYLKDRADMLARIACKSLTLLEEEGLAGYLCDQDKEVGDWWKAHKEADRQEQERIAELQRKQLVKQQALDKLSDEEKEALGIRLNGRVKRKKLEY